MKLHHHPVSTTSRAILLYAADQRIALDLLHVDLFAGEHLQLPFAELNPSCQVPVLEDGSFRLTETSAILKYLAERHGNAAYPVDLRLRARVNERLDWFNTGFVRDFGYGFVYPQLFPHHHRGDAAAQQHTLDWARERARRWLGILDEALIGPHNDFVCGDAITLADYFGAALLTLGAAVRIDYAHWRNISRWLARMHALPCWNDVNRAFDALIVAPRRTQAFANF
ncbi:MAG: glutathione S-transferase family protein [Piscinibacter sp.]|nr:glutathione S-transferase family protein [Piscinibacter sp.]